MPDSVFAHHGDAESGLCLVWTKLRRVILILEVISVVLVLQVESLNPIRAPAHEGQLPSGDHRTLPPDRGSGQGP